MPFNNRSGDRRRSVENESRIPARERISRPAHNNRAPENQGPVFRSLCIKGGWPRGVTNNEIISTIEHCFRKFREYNVRTAMVAGEKICYINFTNEHDARNALEKMHKTVVAFERSLPLEPVIKGVLPVDPRDRKRTPPKSVSPPSNRYREGPKSAVVTKRDEPRQRSPPARGKGPVDTYGSRGGEREVFYQPRNVQKYEEEPPSRILLVSGLDNSVTEKDLYAEFQRYATVMTIDVKVPREGAAFACVAFLNPDEAEKGKRGMQGKRIGSSKCKISYGSSPESNCIWVGGLTKQTSLAALESLFDRFGDVKKIDYSKGDTYAYIMYSSSEGCKTAVKALTGRCICESDSPARFDYVDYDQISAMIYHMKITQKNVPMGASRSPPPTRGKRTSGSPPPPRNHRMRSNSPDGRRDQNRNSGAGARYEYRPPGGDNISRRDNFRVADRRDDSGGGYGRDGRDDRKFNGSAATEKYSQYDRGQLSPSARGSRQSNHSPISDLRDKKRVRNTGSFDKRGSANYRRDSPDEPRQKRRRTPSPMSKARECLDITSLSKVLDSCWSGFLILKNSAFDTDMTLLDGSREVCRKLLTEASTGESATALKITQRLRCETGKLEEVRRRMQSATKDGFCLLLATQHDGNMSNSKPLPDQTSPRQFKNLVSYLKSKQSAGVIGLPIGAQENSGVLHAFPPCDFFSEDLKRIAPKIIEPDVLDDHLVIVILSGSA